jgi:hypothetical protein
MENSTIFHGGCRFENIACLLECLIDVLVITANYLLAMALKPTEAIVAATSATAA